MSLKRRQTLTLVKMTRNAYRVLGLPVNASETAIINKAESLIRKSRLGNPESIGFDIDLLDNLAPDEKEIRSAVSKLMNPKLRVQERIFWFSDHNDWLVNGFAGECADITEYFNDYGLANNPGSNVLTIHEKSLIGLLLLTLDDFELEIISYWQLVYNLLCNTLADEKFWEYQSKFEEQGSFTRPIKNEIEETKQVAYSSLLDPLISIIEEHVSIDNMKAVSRGIIIVSCIEIPLALRNEVINNYLFKIEDEIKGICESITEDVRVGINKDSDRSAGATLDNLKICQNANDLYEKKVVPKADVILKNDVLLQPLIEKRIYDYISRFKYMLGIFFTWGGDFLTADKLMNEAKEITDELLKVKEIEETIQEIRYGVERQKNQIADSVRGLPVSEADSIAPGQYVRNKNTRDTFLVIKVKGEYVTVRRKDGKYVTYKGKNLEIIEDWEYEDENTDDAAEEQVVLKGFLDPSYDEDDTLEEETNDCYESEDSKDTEDEKQNEEKHEGGSEESNKAQEIILYERNHSNQEYSGYGTYTWASGSEYEGAWKDGKPHGWGIYNWANGSMHEGEWKHGRRHGKGLFISSGGFKTQGVWEDDTFKGEAESKNSQTGNTISFIPGQRVCHIKSGKVFIVSSVSEDFIHVKKNDNSFLVFQAKELRIYQDKPKQAYKRGKRNPISYGLGNENKKGLKDNSKSKDNSGYLWIAGFVLLCIILAVLL